MDEDTLKMAGVVIFYGIILLGWAALTFALVVRPAFELLRPVLEYGRQFLIDLTNKRIQIHLAKHGVSTSELEKGLPADTAIGVWIGGDFHEIGLPLQLGLKRDGELIPIPTAPKEPEEETVPGILTPEGALDLGPWIVSPWYHPRLLEWRRKRRLRRYQLEMASHGVVWPKEEGETTGQ